MSAPDSDQSEHDRDQDSSSQDRGDWSLYETACAFMGMPLPW